MKKTLNFCKAISLLSLFILVSLMACNSVKENIPAESADPLPSWNEGLARQTILEFVTLAIDSTQEGFIPVDERIAVFDNDGTLWSEQPMYFQMMFTLDRVITLAPDHPEWKEQKAFKAVIDHVTPAKDSKTALQGKILRDWAKRHGIKDFFDIGKKTSKSLI